MSFLSTLYPKPSNPIHSVNNKYMYLYGNDLHNEIDWCVADSSQPIVVHLCIYRFNRKSCRVIYDEENVVFDPTPFLQFVVEYKSLDEKTPESPEMYTFPLMNYECVSGDNGSHFEDACILHTIETLHMEQIPGASDADAYKGFVMHNDHVFAVIDYDELSRQFKPSENASPPMLAIVDELVLQKRILGVPVDPNVSSMFENNEYMWNIDSDEEHIHIPLCLYRCELIDGESYDDSYSRHPMYENTRVSDAAPLQFIGDEKIEHPLYGDMYVFSKQPLLDGKSADENTAPYQRYAVFLSEPCMFDSVVDESPNVSILEKKRQMIAYLDNQDMQGGIIPDTAANSAANVPENSTDEPLPPVDLTVPAQENPAEVSLEDAPENTNPTMTDEEVENELEERLLMIPSIFFKLSSVDTNGAWGVKYAKQFTPYG